MPEDAENWEGDVTYNLFGPFNQWTQHLFISKKTIYELYPDFLETGRHNLVNSLIVTPSSTLLEITHVESFGVGINNLWGYADQPSSYKMTVKIYDHNIADQGTKDIKDTIQLEEKGQGTTIHEYNEPIDTSEIDKFFNTLDEFKTEIVAGSPGQTVASVTTFAGDEITLKVPIFDIEEQFVVVFVTIH